MDLKFFVGVGPKEDLEALGITSVQDLPVGKNLNNHVSVSVPFTTNLTDDNVLNYNTLNQVGIYFIFHYH